MASRCRRGDHRGQHRPGRRAAEIRQDHHRLSRGHHPGRRHARTPRPARKSRGGMRRETICCRSERLDLQRRRRAMRSSSPSSAYQIPVCSHWRSRIIGRIPEGEIHFRVIQAQPAAVALASFAGSTPRAMQLQRVRPRWDRQLDGRARGTVEQLDSRSQRPDALRGGAAEGGANHARSKRAYP